MESVEYFNKVEPLSLPGTSFYWDGDTRVERLGGYMGITQGENLITMSVPRARVLRDWLNKALPEPPRDV